MTSIWTRPLSLRATLIGLAVSAFLIAGTWWALRDPPGPSPMSLDSGPYQLEDAFPALRFDRPVWLGQAPGDTNHWYVAEQAGRILRFDDQPNAATTEVFADLADRVSRASQEEGLLGVAFHPDYARTRQVVLYWSAAAPRRSVLARYRVADGRLDPTSEQVLLEVPQPYANHNGGALLFGPDGDLYLSLGDGGAGGDPQHHAQNADSLLGSILRIRLNETGYEIPPDNPFASGGGRPEIYAWGLRNVWRMSFDTRGTLWAADVGQNRYEEINHIVRGGNFGWSFREGTREYGSPPPGDPPSDLIEPVYAYGHGDGGASVTGGLVYAGSALPELAGAYLFSDFVLGAIFALLPDSTGYRPVRLTERAGPIASFAARRNGEILVTSFDGRILELRRKP